MSESAFIVDVPEAESCVGALRSRFDASARLGTPAHVTVLYPFMPPEDIGPAVLHDAQAALMQVPSFAFTLARIGRFPATTYLAPEPAQPFIALTRALARAFPAFPPFRGAHDSVVPHLTVANGDAAQADIAAAELAPRVRSAGPIHSVCTKVTLLENTSGRWKPMHVFALPSGPQP